MSFNPRISVIIPAHNYAAYLPDAIGSVISQGISGLEIIVIDDASTDNTKEVVEDFMRKDNRIQYYLQEKSGPTVARNRGVQLAKGDFIQFLDADDLLQKNKLEYQLSVFEQHPEYDIVYGGVKYFHNENRNVFFNTIHLEPGPTWMPKVSGKGEDMVKALLRENIMVISSPLIRKTLFDKFGFMDESLFFNEDWELWLRFAMNNASFAYREHPETMALIRVHGSYSRDNLKMFVFGLKISLDAAQQLKEYKFRKILVPKINYHIKIINQKLLQLLKEERLKAIEACRFVREVSGCEKYDIYASRFQNLPFWLNSFLMKCGAVFRKSKSMLIYGA